MKLASFRRDGRDTYGIVTDDGLIDAGARLGQRYADLRALLAAGALAELAALKSGKADLALDKAEFLPVIPVSEKIMCIGLNYASHVLETGNETPKFPSIFHRFANAQVGHGQPMVRPKNSDKFDFEGELAFVIGRKARHVKPADALGYIAGYACFNDGSMRDFQRHTSQFGPGKNFLHSGAFGPWMTTADEIPDPSKLTLTTRLNGEVVQHTGTDDLIFDIPALIAYISSYTELVPGDVVATGTTGGVGARREPPLFMKGGDVIEVEISGIGILRNPIVDEPR